MISRNSEGGFFAAHWDWLVAGVGVVALVAGVVLFVLSGRTDPDESADAVVARHKSMMKTSKASVTPVELSEYERALQLVSKPPVIAELAAEGGNFLVSPRRIFCPVCGKPIPGDSTACPLCGGTQPEPEKLTLDSDGDGIPDDWEEKHGLNPKKADADEDKDGDGFTNAEEYAAGTDPSDKNSHPDYFDSLKLELPLKETVLPFYFERADQLPGGKIRYYFCDPSKKNSYGARGLRYTPLEGEEIGKTGYIAKSLEKKTTKVKMAAVKGEQALERTKEVYVATVERASDGRTLTLPENDRRIPVDIQATLTFSRGETKTFNVIPGGIIDLFGEKYKVVEIKSVGKGAKVALEDSLHGKIRTVEALEQ